MKPKRLTLFCGHYGSGKTNIAVNYALHLRQRGLSVTLADLDIVNPYFRARDSAADLSAAGVRLLSSPYANSNVDVPALPSDMAQILEDRTRCGVFDVGGDDRGALALGRYAPAIRDEGDYQMLFVANHARPLTRDAQSALEILREIEAACGIPFTGIVHNTNLGRDTTRDTLLHAVPIVEELSRRSRLPIVFTAVRAELTENLPLDNVLPLQLQHTIW